MIRAVAPGPAQRHVDLMGDIDLTGKLLIAMPEMGDPRFDRSVIYMCAHSDEGAMGLILNKPTGDVWMSDLFDQLDIETGAGTPRRMVHFGGPVETGRGFVLHSDDYLSSIASLEVAPGIAMTATLDVLEEIAAGRGPERFVMMLGYSGWGPSQLEGEIAQNGWLTCDASDTLVFDTPADTLWQAALRTLGVDALTLSAAAGRA